MRTSCKRPRAAWWNGRHWGLKIPWGATPVWVRIPPRPMALSCTGSHTFAIRNGLRCSLCAMPLPPSRTPSHSLAPLVGAFRTPTADCTAGEFPTVPVADRGNEPDSIMAMPPIASACLSLKHCLQALTIAFVNGPSANGLNGHPQSGSVPDRPLAPRSGFSALHPCHLLPSRIHELRSGFQLSAMPVSVV
jgi:hypothetical protein